MTWTLARRTQKMNPSVIRELLKLAEKPGVISFAGGLPAASSFPVSAFADACAKVLQHDGPAALQYAASEGFAPLRKLVAEQLPWAVDAEQVLITTGSQQGLDLVAKALIDPGSKVLVESPTYLGALQAFTPMEPELVGVQNLPGSAGGGINLADLAAKASGARFLYVLPNFQNPTGRSLNTAKRLALSDAAAALNLPLVEDNPYGELWFDTPPPAPLAALRPENCIYLGSFSKVLAPGLRLGFLVAPAAVFPKLLQAKQAADLHSPGFNQRLAFEVMAQSDFVQTHLPGLRALYLEKRDAMLAALKQFMPSGVQWNTPAGGMFLWLQLPDGLTAQDLLPLAIKKGVAFVPGAAFYAQDGNPCTMRLSFATPNVAQIGTGIAALAQAIGEAVAEQPR